MVRRAQNRDIAGLLRLLSQIGKIHYENRPDVFKENCQKYDEKALLELLKDENRPIFVAVDDSNHVLGYCFCYLHIKSHPVMHEQLILHIDDFCVDEAHRSRGIGKILFDTVLDFARQQDVANIDLNVWAFNEKAIKFYENLGFNIQHYTMEMKP